MRELNPSVEFANKTGLAYSAVCKPLCQKLISPGGLFNLCPLVRKALKQGVVCTLGLNAGNFVNAEAEIFVPEAVYEKVYIPCIIIAVAVALPLLRGYHSLFLVITDKVGGNAKYFCYISYFVTHEITSISK